MAAHRVTVVVGVVNPMDHLARKLVWHPITEFSLTHPALDGFTGDAQMAPTSGSDATARLHRALVLRGSLLLAGCNLTGEMSIRPTPDELAIAKASSDGFLGMSVSSLTDREGGPHLA